jgi:hypothetical protein
MPKSYRIKTEIGKDKFLQVKLDQDYDKLELLSLAIFPNDIYIRNCAEFGVVCGRVFSNNGFGMPNAKVAIFIPLQDEDADNPVISTLYPYKNFEQFNEDGYKYNLLPYTQSHSGHVPVGTFPDRIDALNNQSVVEVYDKYYKFTAKTNNAGDFMIFGIPVGQHDLFMQVDLSDIGEFSLTPQDLLRSGRATEAQIDGTRFKFSENYSELPQIVTLTKRIQVAPFYGQKEICDYYITRADFDLTLEAFVEIQPTSVFMGSMFSAQDKRKIRKNCKVPAKQGWLCDMIAGPGSIETVRQTTNISPDGRPILESFLLEKDGKVIDENGAWLIELPMNLDYVYTDELGNRQISPDGSRGVPTKGKYRFKVKWNQSTFINDENKRAYFLVPNIKEWGWTSSDDDPTLQNTSTLTQTLQKTQNNVELGFTTSNYYVFESSSNVDSYTISFSYNNGNTWIEKPEYQTIIPYPNLNPVPTDIRINYVLSDTNINGSVSFIEYNDVSYQTLSSYAFSVNWDEYGTTEMITEAINCEDRFYEFEYNKVYTISQLIDRYTSGGIKLYLPQRTVQIKHITDNKCDGIYNQFPTNDAYYRYDIFFIIISAILGFLKFIFIPLIVVVHILAFLWPVIALIIILFQVIYGIIVVICNAINKVLDLFDFNTISCPAYPEITLSIFNNNPFKNIKLPLILSTEDGCQACKCNIDQVDVTDNASSQALNNVINQLSLINISNLANLGSKDNFYIPNTQQGTLGPVHQGLADLAPYAVGANADSDLYRNRMPWFGNQNDGQLLTDVWSTQLPIVERLNLFNTKAKFFDRDDFGLFGSFSPGNTGWNQIKVQFASDIPQNINKNHYDNVIVLVLDDTTGLTQGDLITFQKPSDSSDPNRNETNGIYQKPLTIDVKYAKPKFADGVGTTTYDMYSNQNSVGDFELPRVPDPVAKKTCYPTDVEYYQVIKVEKLTDYWSNRAPLDQNGDNRFSLAWRFLDTSQRPYMGYGDYNETPNNNTIFNNSCMFQRHIRYENQTDIGGGLCVQNVNFPIFDQNVGNNVNPGAQKTFYFDTWNYFTGKTTAAVCFLVRGVDPHSGRLKVKYDLSRLYGYENYGQNGLQVEGDFYLNIPIQASNSDENVYGLSLTEHTFCNSNAIYDNMIGGVCGGNQNTIPLFFKSYFFNYSYFVNEDLGIDPYNTSWTTINHKYYSALNKRFVLDAYDGAYGTGPLWTDSGWTPKTIANNEYWGTPIGVTAKNTNSNFDGKVLTIEQDNNFMTTSWYRRRIKDQANELGGASSYPNCSTADRGPGDFNLGQQANNWWGCSTTFVCSGDNDEGFWGSPVPYQWYLDGTCTQSLVFGNYKIFSLVFHAWVKNDLVNHVGGYWKNEYVEGGSAMNMYLRRESGDWVYGAEGNSKVANVYYDNPNLPPNPQNKWGGGSWVSDSGVSFRRAFCWWNYKVTANDSVSRRSNYMSPCYYTLPTNSLYFSGDLGFNEITMASPVGNVFRSDRLPTSDRPNNGSLIGWGYFLHQNPGFRIFKYIQDCVVISYGGGSSAIQEASVDADNSLYDNTVVESLTDCTKAVDLNSYYVNVSNNTPAIQNQPSFSKEGKYKWFSRGEGCYNLVSRPVLSLFRKEVNGNGETVKYSDVRTVVEWVQRTKLTLAACFDIFSHTFSNNWINGTFYAFPFQLTTRFDTNNQPIKPRTYCKDLVYFNDTINNFFYRSSPYDGINSTFIGKKKDFSNADGEFGNTKNLLYPTTILDLGPKNPYIQELVYSDVYDGYIVDRIPSTTFQETSTLLNVFMLSRMINSSFWNLLIPRNPDTDENGDPNTEGSDDPSIKAFFQNQRWANGNVFVDGNLPGLIDGDYAQMISINSEIGILEFNPNNYAATDLTIGLNGGTSNLPYFGVIFSGDNQWRDLISPRRKVWNENNSTLPLPLPPAPQSYTYIPIKTQNVPFYQWNNVYPDSGTIFGFQNNNYTYNTSTYPNIGYQTLDRFNPSSGYFKPEPDLTKAYKGYIANYTVANNNLTPASNLPSSPISPLTFGTPFHFYFGLIKGSTAMDLFITKYVDTTKVNE